MERYRGEEVIKKGPWTGEEDEVLVNFVKKYGPRDWSSIRAMGLLPRTGKSCRLRWVNRLRPNLKIGCKFSAEEERVVIDLQARFGNKWATISSYLPGRTDNDVKNFWSTRQKRLARVLQSPSLSNKLQKSKGKSVADAHETQTLQEPELNSPKIEEESSSSSNCHPCPTSSMGYPELLLHLMPIPPPFLPSLDSTPLETPFQLPNPELDHLPLFPQSPDPVLGPLEPNFLDPQVNFDLPILKLPEGNIIEKADHEKLGTLDSFFDELSADILDCLN